MHWGCEPLQQLWFISKRRLLGMSWENCDVRKCFNVVQSRDSTHHALWSHPRISLPEVNFNDLRGLCGTSPLRLTSKNLARSRTDLFVVSRIIISHKYYQLAVWLVQCNCITRRRKFYLHLGKWVTLDSRLLTFYTYPDLLYWLLLFTHSSLLRFKTIINRDVT